jgi:hypothetical protein
MDYLNAGVVTTVVQNIWQFSGPSDSATIVADLNAARGVIHASVSSLLHDLVELISLAFPYKPEEIYAMDYSTFLLRVAQAEKKLIYLGIREGPVEIITADEQKPQPSAAARLAERVAKSATQDINPVAAEAAKKAWEAEQEKRKKIIQPKPEPNRPAPKPSRKDAKNKWWKDSPVLEANMDHNIDFQTEATEQHVFGLTGHEKADAHIGRAKMVQDAQWIYKDLIEKLEKQKSNK